MLKEVTKSEWRKENELKDLKTELAALDRKIQLSLKPVNTGEDKSTEIHGNLHYNPENQTRGVKL